MTTIYLKYATWNGTIWVWSSAKSFVCLDYDYIKQSKVITGWTARDIMYANHISKRKKYIVTIGANELYNTTNNTWVETFFDAQRWKLSEVVGFSPEVEVVIMKEELEKARSGGHKGLPKITLELFQKNPS